MTRLELYKEALAPPENWDESKANRFQLELRKKGKYRNTQLPDSFPFLTFYNSDSEDDEDKNLLEKAKLIVRLIGKSNPFTSKKWTDIIPPEPVPVVKPVFVPKTLPKFNIPLLDIKGDSKSFTASYDSTMKTFNINKLIIDLQLNVTMEGSARIHAAIFEGSQRVLNKITQQNDIQKQKIEKDIRAGVKLYLERGLRSKYVNEYTFQRAISTNTRLAELFIEDYGVFHPAAKLPTGYKIWRKWAVRLRRTYLEWLNRPDTAKQVSSVSPQKPVSITVKQLVPEPREEKVFECSDGKCMIPVKPNIMSKKGNNNTVLLCKTCDIAIHDAGAGTRYEVNEDYKDLIEAMGQSRETGRLDPLKVLEEGTGFRYISNKQSIAITREGGKETLYDNNDGITSDRILIQKLYSNKDLKHWIGETHYELDKDEKFISNKNVNFVNGNQTPLLNKIIEQAKTALQQFHKVGGESRTFLHRDIKGDNIVVGESNDIYLFDYDQTVRLKKYNGEPMINGVVARLDYPVNVFTPDELDAKVEMLVKNNTVKTLDTQLKAKGIKPSGKKADKALQLALSEVHAEMRRIKSISLDYFQMGVVLLELGGKFDVANDFEISNKRINYEDGPSGGMSVQGFFNTPIEKSLAKAVWGYDMKNGQMTKEYMDNFVKALRNPTDSLANQFNLPKEILQRIGDEFFKTYEEMEIRTAVTITNEQPRKTFLDYDSMSDAELEDLSQEIENYTDDELELMLNEINVGQAKDDYDSMSDSAPTSIAEHSYNSSSDASELSYNSSSDVTEESYNSSSDMADAYDSISELSASYDSDSDEDN